MSITRAILFSVRWPAIGALATQFTMEADLDSTDKAVAGTLIGLGVAVSEMVGKRTGEALGETIVSHNKSMPSLLQNAIPGSLANAFAFCAITTTAFVTHGKMNAYLHSQSSQHSIQVKEKPYPAYPDGHDSDKDNIYRLSPCDFDQTPVAL